MVASRQTRSSECSLLRMETRVSGWWRGNNISTGGGKCCLFSIKNPQSYMNDDKDGHKPNTQNGPKVSLVIWRLINFTCIGWVGILMRKLFRG